MKLLNKDSKIQWNIILKALNGVDLWEPYKLILFHCILESLLSSFMLVFVYCITIKIW